MVRRLTARRTPGWKALLAIFIAGGGLLWHVLACIESPMAYSPSGKELAFVTMEPYGDDGMALRGTHAYRLFVVSNEDKLRLLDESTDYMLTAPGYHPDGNYICYLRIPLLSPQELKRVNEFVEQRGELYDQATSRPAREPWPPGKPSVPSTQPSGQCEDVYLPSSKVVSMAIRAHATGPIVPAELVARDAHTGKIMATARVDIPLVPEGSDKDYTPEILFNYLLTRTQCTPDGKWIIVNSRTMLLALDTSTGNLRRLAPSAMAAAMSPDGKTIAVLQEKAIGFIQVDGSKAVYVRCDAEPSLSGLAWAGRDMLAVLRAGGDANSGVTVDLIRSDGTMMGSRKLPITGGGKADESGQLAVSPDGRYMAVSFGHHVHFMRRDGKVLKSWSHKDDLMVQPTFSPDSKRVAFKYLDAEEKRASGIVFFTPEGKRTAVVPIPRIAAGTTRPASMPASAPAKE